MIGSMNRVILFVNDVPGCASFYRDVIGLEVVEPADAHWASFNAGGCLISLHHHHIEDRSSRAGEKTVQIVFKASDVAAARQQLIAKGASMGELVVLDDIGLTFCDGQDPEGNLFQISSR